ncbi:hypothetical protein SDC9_208615 [bioreactor metagenome]|uniref:Periplasmic binding protein domain-containing protein n=1 Tax=bioreactor metagenome TaxID=1076179 RepID=A0A645JCK0_9ZZZZ
MGILGVQNAVKLLNGETVDQSIDTGSKLILPDNVQEHKDYVAKYSD